jgi:hypothetical protein
MSLILRDGLSVDRGNAYADRDHRSVERQAGTVGDLPPQDWSLRLTLVFRRDGTDWRLVHRHADPLVRAVDPGLFAALARGDHSV